MLPSGILSLCLFGCSIVIWLNVRELFRDKRAEGVSVAATWIFFSTNVVEIGYFGSRGDYWSAGAAVSMTLANITWLWLAYHYRRWALYYL